MFNLNPESLLICEPVTWTSVVVFSLLCAELRVFSWCLCGFLRVLRLKDVTECVLDWSLGQGAFPFYSLIANDVSVALHTVNKHRRDRSVRTVTTGSQQPEGAGTSRVKLVS